MLTPLALLALLTPSASAVELTIHEGWLLEPVPGTYYENGIGSPTVTYDRAHDQWVMFFETRYAAADAQCADGHWGIGRAVSANGLNWTVDNNLLLEPQPGTYASCQYAHPTILFDGTTWHLWFKAQQRNDACDGGVTPPWGCLAITGVGYATSTDGVTFTVTDEPVLQFSFFGFPTVALVDGVFRMYVAASGAARSRFELFQSVSTDNGQTWSNPEVVLSPGFAPWVEDEIYNPSITCRDDQALRFTLWAGGRDKELEVGGPPTLKTAGLGRAFSTDGSRWAWDEASPFILWNVDPEPPALPDKDWRHWDSVRIGDDYLLFFSQFNDANKNRIGLAYTYAGQQTSFDERHISNRVCGTNIWDTGGTIDTDTVVDTDTDGPAETDDSDTDTDTEVGKDDTKDDGKDCNCATTSPRGLGPVLLLPLLALVRRRRRA
ncbi:MAG: hypothetical protein H6733_15400 [Alphaproteobacteria bacterium]|nr:hypothetical protein [Alphaproteobacteria bacterium]